MKALLLSGGLESTALAFWLRPALCLTIDYGQAPFQGELRAACAVAKTLRLPHETIRCDLSAIGSGALAGKASLAKSASDWPFRNQLLVTLAGMRVSAFSSGENVEILIGTVRSDRIHSDGRVGFVSNLDRLMRSQGYGVRVSAPAIGMSTIKLIEKSGVPNDLLAWTTSCHTGEWSCGECEGCLKRQKVLKRLGATSQIGSVKRH